jgi:hypothetical protein
MKPRTRTNSIAAKEYGRNQAINEPEKYCRILLKERLKVINISYLRPPKLFALQDFEPA